MSASSSPHRTSSQKFPEIEEDVLPNAAAWETQCVTPSTPGLEENGREYSRSPLTPATPRSVTAWASDLQEHLPDHAPRELNDATTVFVGGLENFGPQRWNEDKLRNLFCSCGTIVDVSYITPSKRLPVYLDIYRPPY